MSFYIADKVFKDAVAIGFATEKAAEDYLMRHHYMGQYWWHYEVKEWTKDIAYGVTCSRDSLENGGTTFWLFETWDEAVAFACEKMEAVVCVLVDDFDFEDDIYQIDMTKEM